MRTLYFVPRTLLLWAEFFWDLQKVRGCSQVSLLLLSLLPRLVYGKVPADLPALVREETLLVFIVDYKIALSSVY